MREVSAKCTVTSMAEGEVDTTLPDGWFKCAMGFLIAEWSSKIASHKVKGGMARRLEDPKAICSNCGKVHMGRVPNACKLRVGQEINQITKKTPCQSLPKQSYQGTR